ncbi:hypothetical protein ACP70R_006338 [Stipagrostis hirtigluma subsp. patula]
MAPSPAPRDAAAPSLPGPRASSYLAPLSPPFSRLRAPRRPSPSAPSPPRRRSSGSRSAAPATPRLPRVALSVGPSAWSPVHAPHAAAARAASVAGPGHAAPPPSPPPSLRCLLCRRSLLGPQHHAGSSSAAPPSAARGSRAALPHRTLAAAPPPPSLCAVHCSCSTKCVRRLGTHCPAVHAAAPSCRPAAFGMSRPPASCCSPTRRLQRRRRPSRRGVAVDGLLRPLFRPPFCGGEYLARRSALNIQPELQDEVCLCSGRECRSAGGLDAAFVLANFAPIFLSPFSRKVFHELTHINFILMVLVSEQHFAIPSAKMLWFHRYQGQFEYWPRDDAVQDWFTK